MRTVSLASLLAAPLLAACVGEAPAALGDDDAPAPDAGIVDTSMVTVSGMTMDYFTNLPIAGAALTTEGLEPGSSATSGTDGGYALEEVLPGSVFYVNATRTAFRATRSDMVKVLDVDATSDLYVISNADAARQSATLGMTYTPGTAIVVANLLRNNGTPLLDIPLADITLVDALGAPVGLGPYFFGASGDVVGQLDLLVSTAYEFPIGSTPRARVGFLDVPPGSYTLKVNYPSGGGGGGGGGGGEIRTYEVPAVAIAEGAALLSTGGQDDDGAAAGTPTFATNVWPMLQKGAEGGVGCANCHTAGGAMPALQFDLPAADVMASIMGRPGCVDLLAPANSMLLSKPLYEVPANHPNATFPTDLDPNYLMIMGWIAGGTLP